MVNNRVRDLSWDNLKSFIEKYKDNAVLFSPFIKDNGGVAHYSRYSNLRIGYNNANTECIESNGNYVLEKEWVDNHKVSPMLFIGTYSDDENNILKITNQWSANETVKNERIEKINEYLSSIKKQIKCLAESCDEFKEDYQTTVEFVSDEVENLKRLIENGK